MVSFMSGLMTKLILKLLEKDMFEIEDSKSNFWIKYADDIFIYEHTD